MILTKEKEKHIDHTFSDDWGGDDFEEIELSILNFSEVTFENSPQQVKLKLINNL